MARPIQADAEATRARVLRSAKALFSHKGLAETTMREIASAAGVTMATVHHYYGGKADLYRACIDAMYAELDTLRDELDEAVEATAAEGLGGLVEDAVRRSYRFARKHRPAVQLMMRTVLDTGELEADKRERYLLPFLDHGTRVLVPLLRRPEMAIRMALLSLNHLIVRFTLSTPRELALVVGIPSADEETALNAIEDYLVALALERLGLEGVQR